jgi:hypothetical protein
VTGAWEFFLLIAGIFYKNARTCPKSLARILHEGSGVCGVGGAAKHHPSGYEMSMKGKTTPSPVKFQQISG